MRKVIALILAAAMVFSLAVVAGADGNGTAKLIVECTDVTDGVATFDISIDAPSSGVAALQFFLSAEGMTQVANSVTYPDSATLTNVFNLEAIDPSKKGNFGYTKEESSDIGKFIAYGGDVKTEGRYLTGEVQLLTIKYQLDDGVESGTLNISEFKACQSGDKAIGDSAYICTAPESVVAKRPSTGGVVWGDVNGDGEVDNIDAAMIYSHFNGNITFTAEQLAKADVDGSGEVDNIDAAMVYSYFNGNITKFPAEG